MKVVHICPFLGEQMGGSERYVHNLALKQSENHEVHIFTTTQHMTRVGKSRINGVSYHKFYSPLAIWNINPLSFILKDLMNSKFDVMHIHSYIYSLSNQAIVAKVLKRERALLQLHGGIGPLPYRTSWYKSLAKEVYDNTLGKFTIESSDIIASVSKSDLTQIMQYYDVSESRLKYVPNFVNTDLFTSHNPTTEHRDTFLYIGDLEPWKGILTLIKWIRSNKNIDGPGIKIRFVGQGTCFPYLVDLQRKLENNSSNIQLEILGQRKHSEIPTIMRESKALILPSHWEGMPTVILEAMAAGLPVLSTSVGDLSHILSHKENSLIIDRGLNLLEESILLVNEDQSLVKHMTNNARKLVESEFTIQKVIETLDSAYTELKTAF